MPAVAPRSQKPSPRPETPLVVDQTIADPLLDAHAQWLKQGAPETSRVSFDRRIYRNVTFAGSLAQANFHGATFQSCSFAKDLDLTETDFSEADLTGADLRETRNLAEHRLGASKLAYAKLPDEFQFKGLDTVKEMAARAEKILFALLASCATVLVLTRVIPHQQLFQPAQSINLPVLGLPVPIRTFFNLTPWLLLVLYVYLLSTLLKLWSSQRDLPAILPNNRLLFRDVPALPNFSVMPFGWCWRSFPHGSRKRKEEAAGLTQLVRVDRLLVVLAVWWMVPLTMVWLWMSYLPRHSATDTSIHVVAVALAVGMGVGAYGRMLAHLTRGFRNWTQPLPVRMSWWADQRGWVSTMDILLYTDARRRLSSGTTPRKLRLSTVIACMVVAGLSLGATSAWMLVDGRCGDDVARHGKGRGRCYWFAANLVRAQLDSVRLDEQNLRRAFLADASLRKAKFEDALMDGAQLSGADAFKATFKDTRLRGAILWEAKLDRAELKEAHLQHADLRGASLTEAELQGARFDGANLTGADFTEAIVCGASFIGAQGEVGALLAGAHGAYLIKGRVKPCRARSVDPADNPPGFLEDGDEVEFARWAQAERAVERLDSVITEYAPTGGLPRAEVLDLTANINVSMAASTQRKQLQLTHWLARYGTLHDPDRVPYTPETRLRLDRFIDDVQDKARNHCVLPAQSRLPVANRSPSPFWTGKVGDIGS